MKHLCQYKDLQNVHHKDHKDLMIKLSGQKPKEMTKNPLEEVFKNVNGNPFSESKESEKIDIDDDLYVDFEEMDEKENK